MARQRTLGKVDLGVIDRLRLGWRLLRDPRVPAFPKWLLPAGAAIYLFSPIDLIPDIALGIGQLDDLSIIAVALIVVTMLTKWSPQAIVDEHAYDLGIYNDLPQTPEQGTAKATGGGKPEPVEAKYWVDDWR